MQLVTVSDLAQTLKVPLKTIYYWVGARSIPFVKVGRHLRFDVDQVLAWFKERTALTHASCRDALDLVPPSRTQVFEKRREDKPGL